MIIESVLTFIRMLMNTKSLAYLIIVECLSVFTCVAFEHDVTPSCPAEADECEFEWKVDFLLTMTLFNWTTYTGEPINFKNGTFCKRDIYSCSVDPSVCIPVTSKELDRVVTVDGSYTLVYAINNQFPGPSLIVYENQKVTVRVQNNLMSEGLTIHWHGMYQTNTPWMDGASMITQCPILPGQSFTYRFDAYPAGTHWYHSHVGTQRADGLAGALIVLPRKQRENIVPLGNDFLFLVQDMLRIKTSVEMFKLQEWYMLRFAESFDDDTCYGYTRDHDSSLVGTHPLDAALINGRGQPSDKLEKHIENEVLPIEIFSVTQGKYYRFRIINTANLYPFRISVDNHSFEVISSDGHDLEPEQAQSLIVFPGERFDILLYANATPGNYWFRAHALEVLDAVKNPRTNLTGVLSVLHYDEVIYKRPISKIQDCKQSEICRVVNCPYETISISVLEPNSICIPLADLRATKQTTEQYPVPIPANENDFQEVFLNFHFPSDGIRPERAAVNGLHFLAPSSALQLSSNVPNVVINCSTIREGDPPLCTHILKLKKGVVIQITMASADTLDAGLNHPIHLHGTSFHVLKTGFPQYDDSGFSCDYNQDLNYSNSFRDMKWKTTEWNGGNVPECNLKDPPKKDTVIVPWRGYTIIRFRSDNPGFWFMHCHLETHQLIGMAIVLQIGEQDEMVPAPISIPRCGNFEDTTVQCVQISDYITYEIDDSGFVLINIIWVVAAGFVLICLICMCLGLGSYALRTANGDGKR